MKKPNFFLYILLIIFISFTASAAFAYSVKLAWDPPTINVDGTPCDDLAGYKVYYGTSSGPPYSKKINVGNATTCKVGNLTAGHPYYFSVRAYDTSGNKSDYSNEVSTARYILTANKSGTGKGKVTSSDKKIDCGTDCKGAYKVGTVATLMATPKAGSIFAGWSGGGCVGNPCTLTMNTNTNVKANFNTTPTSITVTSPNGGNTWQAGTAQTINWTYTGNPGQNVRIKLFKGGVLKRTINTGTLVGSGGSGSYTWTIPLGQPPGKDYKIKVVSKANSSFADFSNKFTITPPLTVTSPNGGESIASATFPISWNAQPGVEKFKLKYSLNNGETWKLIRKDITGTSYEWSVPITKKDKTKCLVKVCGYNDSDRKVGCDKSDAPFTIEGSVQ